MTILFIAEFFPSNKDLKFTGGVEAYNYFLVKELAKRHRIMVFCQKVKGQKIFKKIKNVEIISIGFPITRIDTSVLTIPQRLFFQLHGLWVGMKIDFDIVQGNNFVTYPLAFMLGLIKKKPKIAWYPDVFIGSWKKLTGNLSGFIGEFVERVYLRLPWSKFVALSNSTRDKLLNQGIAKEKISTIYGGIDSDFYKRSLVKKSNVFTIVTISRLVKYKNVDVLIKAVNLLKDKGLNINLEIIGNGPEKNNLTKLIKQNLLTRNIIIRSDLSRMELKKSLEKGHLFCLPSTQEGFGLVILEAASCGLPYVVSDLPVLREITLNGIGGTFFEPGDYKSLAHQIEKYYTNKNLLKKSSLEVVRLAEKYSWENIALSFENVYENLLKKRIHVLMLIDAWFPHVGGGQVHVLELSRKLTDLGCKVTVLTRNLGNWSNQDNNIEVIRLGFVKKFANIIGRVEYLLLALFFSLFKKYDVLHAHAFSPGLIVPIIRKLKGKPAVFTAHGEGLNIAGLGIKGDFLQDLVFYGIKYDAEITVARNTFKKETKTKNVFVIPNGVNVSYFKDAWRDRNDIKNILYFGRLFKDKGVHLLIEAIRDLNGYNLTIVGEGPEEMKLKEQGKGAKIKFKGLKIGKDLLNEIKKADLLVLPSLVEGMPIRLLEAWASKLPVLATKVGDNEYFIKDEEDGFLCDANFASIKESLIKLKSYKKINKITKQGFKKVQDYSWEVIAKRTLEVYKGVLNAKA